MNLMGNQSVWGNRAGEAPTSRIGRRGELASEGGKSKREALSISLFVTDEVLRGKKMNYSGLDPESYITEYTLVYEEQVLYSL